MAQEQNETFTLQLVIQDAESLFGEATDTLITELNVTIFDSECKFIFYACTVKFHVYIYIYSS